MNCMPPPPLLANSCAPRKTSLRPAPPPSSVQYHNDELYANLYTMHSWSGIVVVTLFFANYLGGFFNFFAGLTPQWVRGGSRCCRLGAFVVL